MSKTKISLLLLVIFQFFSADLFPILKYGSTIELKSSHNRLLGYDDNGKFLAKYNVGDPSTLFTLVNPLNWSDTSTMQYGNAVSLKAKNGKYLSIYGPTKKSPAILTDNWGGGHQRFIIQNSDDPQSIDAIDEVMHKIGLRVQGIDREEYLSSLEVNSLTTMGHFKLREQWTINLKSGPPEAGAAEEHLPPVLQIISLLNSTGSNISYSIGPKKGSVQPRATQQFPAKPKLSKDLSNALLVNGLYQQSTENFSEGLVLSLPPLYGKGVAWLSEGMQTPNKGTVVFYAKGNEETKIMFADEQGSYSNTPHYTITLGGKKNTQSSIEKLGKTVCVIDSTQNPNASSPVGRFTLYWVSINDGFVMVGKGLPGTNTFLSWQDPNPPAKIDIIGFGSKDMEVDFTDIEVTYPVTSDPITNSYIKQASVNTSATLPNVWINNPLRIDDVGGVQFDATPNANSSINILFGSKNITSDANLPYMITAGSDGIILKKKNKMLVSAQATQEIIPDGKKSISYWASINRGFITFGYKENGQQKLLLVYQDSNPVFGVTNIGITQSQSSATANKSAHKGITVNNFEITPAVYLNYDIPEDTGPEATEQAGEQKKSKQLQSEEGEVIFRMPFEYKFTQRLDTLGITVKDSVTLQQKNISAANQTDRVYTYEVSILDDGTPSLKQTSSPQKTPMEVRMETKISTDKITAQEEKEKANARDDMANDIINTSGGFAMGTATGGGSGIAGDIEAGTGAVMGIASLATGIAGMVEAGKAESEKEQASTLAASSKELALEKSQLFQKIAGVSVGQYLMKQLGATNIPQDVIDKTNEIKDIMNKMKTQNYNPLNLNDYPVMIQKYNDVVDRIISPYNVKDLVLKKEIIDGLSSIVQAVHEYDQLKDKPIDAYQDSIKLLINAYENPYLWDEQDIHDKQVKQAIYYSLSIIFKPVFNTYNKTTTGFIIYPMEGEFLWLPTDTMKFANNKGSIIFQVQGDQDAIIGFAEQAGITRGTKNELYQVVIGASDNKKSYVELQTQGNIYNVKSIDANQNENASLSPLEFRQYWISINNGKVVLGVGNLSSNNALMKWTDRYPISNIRYIGISNGNSSTTYRGIITGPPVEEAEQMIKSGKWSQKIDLKTIQKGELTAGERRYEKGDAKEFTPDTTPTTQAAKTREFGEPAADEKTTDHEYDYPDYDDDDNYYGNYDYDYGKGGDETSSTGIGSTLGTIAKTAIGGKRSHRIK